MVAAQSVFQPFDRMAAETTEVAGTFATVLDFVGAVLRRETIKGVEAIVILVDLGGLQVLIEEHGGVAVGAAQLKNITGNIAGLVETFDEEGEMFGGVVVPIAIKREAAKRRVPEQGAQTYGCEGFRIA